MNKNYPKIYQEDIKVLGRVVSISTENKVAAAEQVFDEDFQYSDLTRIGLDSNASIIKGLDQYTINRLFGKKLKAFDNAGLIPDVDGFLQNIKINNITVKGGGTFTGDVTFNDNVTVKKKLNVDGGIDSKGIVRCKDVIVGWDGTDNTGYSVKDAIDYLQACCAEVKAMLENLPSGGGVKLTVNPTSLNMNIGDTKEITVTSEPALAGSPTATSSDSSVASVTVSGGKVIVTGKKAGTATITIEWGGARKTVQVTVTDPTPVEDVYEISLSPNPVNIDVTNSSTYPVTITATRTKNGTATTEGSIDWRSTNPAIATVSNGVVSPVEGGPNGTVTITAIWNGVSDTCTVTVSGQEVPEPTKYTLQYQVSWPDNPGQTEVWASQEYYANDTITLPTEPTFAGYTFAGWDGLPYDTMKMPSDNLTVEAKWTENGDEPERLYVIVTGEHAEVLDYTNGGGSWNGINSQGYNARFEKDTAGMGEYITVGSNFSCSIRPLTGYKITGVTATYEGAAADEYGIAEPYDGTGSGELYIMGIKSVTEITILTEATGSGSGEDKERANVVLKCNTEGAVEAQIDGGWYEVSSAGMGVDHHGSDSLNYIYVGDSVATPIRAKAGYKITGITATYEGAAAEDAGYAADPGSAYVTNIQSHTILTINVEEDPDSYTSVGLNVYTYEGSYPSGAPFFGPDNIAFNADGSLKTVMDGFTYVSNDETVPATEYGINETGGNNFNTVNPNGTIVTVIKDTNIEKDYHLKIALKDGYKLMAACSDTMDSNTFVTPKSYEAPREALAFGILVFTAGYNGRETVQSGNILNLVICKDTTGDTPSTGGDEQSEGYDVTLECATPEGIISPSSFPATYKTDAEGCIEIPIALADGWEMIKTDDVATNAIVFYPSVDYPKDEDGLVIKDGYGYNYDENKIYINHTTCSWRIVLRPTQTSNG